MWQISSVFASKQHLFRCNNYRYHKCPTAVVEGVQQAWNNCYIGHGTTVSPIDNNCFIRSKQLFHSMFSAIPFKVIVYHCVVLQPPSVAQSVESLYICGV